MEEKAATGRPSKFDPERAAAIIALVEAGNYFTIAAKSAGVTSRTLLRWMDFGKSDRPDREPFRQFRRAIIRAKYASEANAVKRIHDAALAGAWQADFKYLACKFPERWAAKKKVDATHSGAIATTVTHEVKAQAEGELTQWRQAMKDRLSAMLDDPTPGPAGPPPPRPPIFSGGTMSSG